MILHGHQQEKPASPAGFFVSNIRVTMFDTMEHTYIPIADRILVRQDAPVAMKGKLYIPEPMQSRPTYAQVLAIGDGVKHIKVGDRIAFTRYAPMSIELEGEELFVMRENDASLIIR